ncbi:MAG: MarR family transcriptional regulator [Candidatus Bathyarchaeota archaeon]|nr:MarR family transcriptional regulator [Candidatus Bathyarchaeum tardum]WGM89668.1 MAG: MarR family transcriptional regulator [Candidatus Bathyarchaeum tardum]
MISDVFLILTSILLFGTISVLFLYYKRIITLRHEYHNAKGIVSDIVVSIDNQLMRQKEGVLYVAHKIEKVAVENQEVAKKVEEYEEKLIKISNRITDFPSDFEEKFSGQINEIRNEFEGIKETQEKVFEKLVEIEKIKYERHAPDVKIKAAIPIKKEKALEPLTETELIVLETIGKEGEKTAPEIQKMISLTREHTARLMKKLYKDGYLERDTHRMPYVYRLKEEMEKILKRREINPS